MHNDNKELAAVFDLLSDDDLENQTLETISQNFKNIQKKKDVQILASFLVLLYQVEEPRLFRARTFCIFFLLWEIYREPNFLKNCPYLTMFRQALNLTTSRDDSSNEQQPRPKSVYDVLPLPSQERMFLFSLLVEQRPQTIKEEMKRTITSILTKTLTEADCNIDVSVVIKSLELAKINQNNAHARVAIPNYMMLPRRDYAFVSQFHLRNSSFKSAEIFRIPIGEERRTLRDNLINLFQTTCIPTTTTTNSSSTNNNNNNHNNSSSSSSSSPEMLNDSMSNSSYFIPSCARSEPPPIFTSCLREELTWIEPTVYNYELSWDQTLLANIDSFLEEDESLKDILEQLHTVSMATDQADNIKRLFQTIAFNPRLIKDYGVEAEWIPTMVELNNSDALDFIILIGNLRHCSADTSEEPEEVKLSRLTVNMYKSKEGKQESDEHQELCDYIYQLFEKMLHELIHMRISMNSIEVLNRLHMYVVIPPSHFLAYAVSGVEHLRKETDRNMQQRLSRIWCTFLQSLVRNRFLDYDDLMPWLGQFCLDFGTCKEATNLYRLLKSCQESSNREKDPLKK